MDTVIEKISEIESAATGIMEDANERKKAFAKEMEERTAAFDAQLEAETNKRIEELRARMEIEMNERLEKQRNDSQNVLRAMEQRYQEHDKGVIIWEACYPTAASPPRSGPWRAI